MIYIIRASHTNEFELQNYKGIDATVISSLNPLTKISRPVVKLWSPTDLPNFPYRKQIFNRLFGGEQWLIGLEKYIFSQSNESIHRTILHTAETYTPYTHQAVQLRKRGLISKLVCTCWETIPHNNEKFSRLRKWKQDAYRYVDIFHAPTERAKSALVKEGVDPSKIVVIPYGVDLSRFKPAPSKIKNIRPLILTVARLEKEKGMESLEQIAALLSEFDFLVIGSGSYQPKGTNIKIVTIPYSQIHKIYQSADLFFLPSESIKTWEEQYGMALIEAMATGLPIVTTDSGAIPEVIKEAGPIVEQKNVDKMVKTIKNILNSPDQKSKYSHLSLLRAMTHFDAQLIGKRIFDLY